MVLLSNENMDYAKMWNLYPNLRTAAAKKREVNRFVKDVKYRNVWNNNTSKNYKFDPTFMKNYGFTTREQLFQAYLNTLKKYEQNERNKRVGMTLNEKAKLAERAEKVQNEREKWNVSRYWLKGLVTGGKYDNGTIRWLTATRPDRGQVVQIRKTHMNLFTKKHPEATKYIIPPGNNRTKDLSREIHNYVTPNFVRYFNAQILRNEIKRAEKKPVTINTALRQFQMLYNKVQKLKARQMVQFLRMKLPTKNNGPNLLKFVPEATLRKRKANTNANLAAKKAHANANQAALNANRANRRRLIEEATRARPRNAGTYTVNNSGRVKLKKN